MTTPQRIETHASLSKAKRRAAEIRKTGTDAWHTKSHDGYSVWVGGPIRRAA